MEALKAENDIQNVQEQFKLIYKDLKKLNNDLFAILKGKVIETPVISDSEESEDNSHR